MSQNISVESTSTNFGINPTLQAALSSLDVQLEEELARYRRQRTGRPLMSPKGLGRNQTHKPIDLISVERVRNQPQRPALGMSTAPLASFPLFMVQPAPEASSHQTPPNPLNITSDTSPGMVVAAQNQADDNFGSQPGTEPPTPPIPLAGGGGLATAGISQSPPEDYLESSEQLLRSLAEAETAPAPKKPFTEKLLTPLGIGSLLLLLLSSATAVYFLSNPSSFAAILDRFFGTTTPTPVQNNTVPTSTNNSGKNTSVVNGPDLASDEFVDLNLNTLSHLETSPKPSPSASSLQVVPSLPTLPNTGTATTVAPSVVPNTALPRRSADLSSVLLATPPTASAPYAPVPRVAPLPTPATAAPKSSTAKSNTSTQLNKSTQAKSSKSQASTQVKSSKSHTSTQVNKSTQTKPAEKKQPQASPSPAAVTASTTGVPGSYYYVFLNSGGESALEQARTIISDAYLEQFPQGTRIQMGAFPTESEAKTMVEKLQGQGLAASIYHP